MPVNIFNSLSTLEALMIARALVKYLKITSVSVQNNKNLAAVSCELVLDFSIYPRGHTRRGLIYFHS